MAERGLFKEIRESLDEIMSGRRYLISTVEKLKKSLPDIAPQVEKLSGSIDSIANLANISTELTSALSALKGALTDISTLSSAVTSMKNDVQNMSNNIMAMRPVVDSVRDYSQRNESGLRGIAQALQTIMSQLGELLAK